jgi:hypothetical protein
MSTAAPTVGEIVNDMQVSVENVKNAKSEYVLAYQKLEAIYDASEMIKQRKQLQHMLDSMAKLVVVATHLADNCTVKYMNVDIMETKHDLDALCYKMQKNVFVLMTPSQRGYETVLDHDSEARQVYTLHGYVAEQQLFRVHHTTDRLYCESDSVRFWRIIDELLHLCESWTAQIQARARPPLVRTRVRRQLDLD